MVVNSGYNLLFYSTVECSRFPKSLFDVAFELHYAARSLIQVVSSGSAAGAFVTKSNHSHACVMHFVCMYS